MHHDLSATATCESQSHVWSATFALNPGETAFGGAIGEQVDRYSSIGSSLLSQFLRDSAKFMADLEGDTPSIYTVTRVFVDLIQPVVLLHASVAKPMPLGAASSVVVEDWLEKVPATSPPVTFSGELRSAAVDIGQRCINTGQCELTKTVGPHQLLAIPLVVRNSLPQAIVVAVRTELVSETLPILMAYVACVTTMQLSCQIQSGQMAVKQFQTIAKNNGDLEAASNLPQAATHLTTRWSESLQLSHMAWVEVQRGRPARLAGLSGSTEIDPAGRIHFELLQATQALLNAGGTTARWSVGQPVAPKFLRRESLADSADASPSFPLLERCLQSITSELMVPAVLAIPVLSAGQLVAYLFLLGGKEITSPSWEASHRHLLELVRVQVALAVRIHQTAWQRMIAKPAVFLRHWRWWLAASFVGLVGLAAWPMPYTMYGDCELVTTDRRYAVAPYHGTIKEVLVKPGDVVISGKLLATMDDRELKIELAGKQAALEREQNQIKVSRAENDFAKARMAELEVQRMTSEVDLLQHHLSNREIRSPIAGTIVQGDLSELAGAPVEVGSHLFEIAGLDELSVQIEIPEYQYRYLRLGQEVRLSLEAFPYETFVGGVERLHPRAATRDDGNVFLAEICLANPSGKLRPGMKGQARVVGEHCPLVWKWLHYPYEKTRAILGWF